MIDSGICRCARASTRRLSNSSSKESMDTKLLEMLVCPVTKGPLIYDRDKQELISRTARLAYPIRDGIPVRLAGEARKLTPEESEELPKEAPSRLGLRYSRSSFLHVARPRGSPPSHCAP